MNPDPFALSYWGEVRKREQRVEAERRDRLHRAAKARRRKAKRGGPR